MTPNEERSKKMETLKLMLQERVQYLIDCIDKDIEHQDSVSAFNFSIAVNDVKTIVQKLYMLSFN